MKPLKFLLLWHVFAFSYVAIFLLTYTLIPEKWIFSKLSERYGFIDIIIWDNAYMTTVLLSALLVNAIVIFGSMQLLKRIQITATGK